MAIADNPSSSEQAAPSQPINIEAWTEQATAALSSVTISVPGDAVQGPTTSLAIPLDEQIPPMVSTRPLPPSAIVEDGGYYRRKELARRDSQKKREALLKGREGSKRRLKWEDGRFLS